MAEAKEQQQQPLLKLTVQHYRKEGVPEEAFTRWIQEDHVRRAVGILQKHKIVRYAQYLTPSFAREAFQADVAHRPGWKLADYDAVISYWVRSPDDMRALLADPEWAEQVNARETEWADTVNVVTMVGWETVYLDDGQIVNTTPLAQSA